MYPTGDLTYIEARKARIRRRIARRRETCVENAAIVSEKLETVDRLYAQWRQIAPFVKLAAIPLGFLFTRKVKRSGGFFSTALKWLPLGLKLFQSFRAAKTSAANGAPVGASAD